MCTSDPSAWLDAQGQGIGTALMHRYIEHLKQEQTAGYLETDRLSNMEFYKKFGFVVQREEQLIGTPTWYMWRPREK
jgi:predicted N-acetyltransferase YhbS